MVSILVGQEAVIAMEPARRAAPAAGEDSGKLFRVEALLGQLLQDAPRSLVNKAHFEAPLPRYLPAESGCPPSHWPSMRASASGCLVTEASQLAASSACDHTHVSLCRPRLIHI